MISLNLGLILHGVRSKRNFFDIALFKLLCPVMSLALKNVSPAHENVMEQKKEVMASERTARHGYDNVHK